MKEAAIEMEKIKFVYPDGYTAVESVGMSIMRGERIAILGPNGAGKTTLLMLIDGLLTPSEGQVNVLGMPVNKNNLHKVRTKVGFVFQDPDDQLFCPTLWEDVTFGPLSMDLSKGEVARRAKEALKVMGLEGYEEKPPHRLSAGEKKKAAIATVLAMEPEILILDEPTANLDPKSRTELIKIVDNLHKERKITLITATHDVNFVPAVADRVYVLNKGRIIAEGHVREVFSNSRVMMEANLEPPVLAHFFSILNERSDIDLIKPLPLTIEEAITKMKCLLKKS
jgi:cobalt/nickel transport system ATP-binding protein